MGAWAPGNVAVAGVTTCAQTGYPCNPWIRFCSLVSGMRTESAEKLTVVGRKTPLAMLVLGALSAGLSLSACVAGSVNTQFPGRESGYAATQTSDDVSLEEIMASVQRDGSGGSVSSEHYLRLFEAAAVVLAAQCAACHRDGNFDLRSADTIREGIFRYPGLVKRGEPEASRLLTKGAHAGPALKGMEADTVAAWIIASASQNKVQVADGPTGPQSMAPVALKDGEMAISLAELGLSEGYLGLRVTMQGGDVTLSHATFTPGSRLDTRFDALRVTLTKDDATVVSYALRQRRIVAPARGSTEVPGVHMLRLDNTPGASPAAASFKIALHFDNLVLTTAK